MQCICGNEIPVSKTGIGRPRVWCSDACGNRVRVQEFRQRKKQAFPLHADVMESEDIRFYCGVGEPTFNHHPVHTGPYACVSPVRGRGGIDKKGKQRKQSRNGVHVPGETQAVILDSGAFSDTTYHRCTFEEALQRQIKHASDYAYIDQVSHFADYDVLIDEQDRDGVRVKERWLVDMADYAVSQTILAAKYMNSQRHHINQEVGHSVGLVLSAQGVDTSQYLRCAERILPYFEDNDIFGLGGWCILGMQPKLLPTFFETMNTLIPMLKAQKIKRIHIWGVCFAEALGPLLFLCDHYQRSDGLWGWDEENRIQLSTDSVGPTTRVVKELSGKPGYSSWGYASWYQTVPLAHVLDSCKQVDEQGNKAPACSPDTYCRGLTRTRHVNETIQWLARFREREQDLYRHVEVKEQVYKQVSLFADEAI